VRTARPEAIVEPLRRVIQSSSPNVPYAHVRTLADQFGRHTRAWTLGATMFTVFGALALVLAAIGLYSVVMFTMAQRRHEYGVRLALGATGSHLVWITMLRGLFPATIGLIIGVVLALAGGKLVAALLFETRPHDANVLGSVSAVLLGAAALACLVPGLRAARTDPIVALRAE
jgi:ABC-type antimicrobial peptide transport system permease subunit